MEKVDWFYIRDGELPPHMAVADNCKYFIDYRKD